MNKRTFNIYGDSLLAEVSAINEYHKLKQMLNLTTEEKSTLNTIQLAKIKHKKIEQKNLQEKKKQKKELLPLGLKRCTKCLLIKPINDFYLSGYKSNGERRYSTECKICFQERRKEYYKTTKR